MPKQKHDNPKMKIFTTTEVQICDRSNERLIKIAKKFNVSTRSVLEFVIDAYYDQEIGIHEN